MLHHRQVCTSDLCPRCSLASETIDHCLFLCGDSVDIWNMCGLHSVPSTIQGVDRLTWCKQLGKRYGNIVFVTLWIVCSLAVTHRRVTWSRPAEGFVCLNVDGSFLGSTNTAGYGGLLRSRDGEFIWGFYGAAAMQNILQDMGDCYGAETVSLFEVVLGTWFP
ncbi:hypothetical protein A2U01_0004550 [Trifolium medium]|uniref:Uncharacterized protein n=1 Tax=Trifolium medium TaxID=97028 RepID=A0A392MBU5_9FABA|nr:hypothetical protein [Trifolium medium]